MAVIFDLDQTLVDSSIAEPYRDRRLWQRVYAAKDSQTVRKSLIISAIVYPIIGILIIIIGLSISTELHGIDPDMALIKGFSTSCRWNFR